LLDFYCIIVKYQESVYHIFRYNFQAKWAIF